MMKSIFYIFILDENCQLLGARSALSMGVASEAIVKLYLFYYRFKVSLSISLIFDLHKIFFVF
jgi:hypothetical protein